MLMLIVLLQLSLPLTHSPPTWLFRLLTVSRFRLNRLCAKSIYKEFTVYCPENLLLCSSTNLPPCVSIWGRHFHACLNWPSIPNECLLAAGHWKKHSQNQWQHYVGGIRRKDIEPKLSERDNWTCSLLGLLKNSSNLFFCWCFWIRLVFKLCCKTDWNFRRGIIFES